MTEYSLISTSGLSKPATLLIEKISDAIGRHFDPRQAVRMAEAEAEANRIRKISEAETEIEVAELRARAASRFMNEEMTRQENIESITRKALSGLNDDASPDDIENDWISNFFDKCRIVSDEDMQELWGRVLAGQGNNPGSFSRKTVNLLTDLDKSDAQLFTTLCGFGWAISGGFRPLVFDVEHEIYTRHGINFGSILQLETLGLIRTAGITGFKAVGLPQRAIAAYGDRRVEFNLPKNSQNELDVGKIILTKSGFELLKVVSPTVVAGFFEYVYDRWESQSLVLHREPN